MPSHHDGEDVHYSGKAGTAEQQRDATRNYTYKSYWRGGKEDESEIKIQVRNISWSPIRASLVRELIGVIYDEDEVQSKADKEKWFSNRNTSLTTKWTVDQRNNIAQLYTYDVDGEKRPKGLGHPRGTWMQYNTLFGSGYVFNKTRNSNVREFILSKARELFVHKRPHSETMEGDWTCVEKNGEYKLDERKNFDDWDKAKAEDDLPWVARTEITKTIKSGFTLPYIFRDSKFEVLNDCKVNLGDVTLDKLFHDYFLSRPFDPQAKKWLYWRITEEKSSAGGICSSISKYHPSGKIMPYHTSSNKTVWINNNTTNQAYEKVQGRLETTSEFQRNAQNGSHWILNRREGDGAEKDRLTVEEISNDKSKGQERSRFRSRFRSRSSSHSHSRYKRPEIESGNESSSSTVSDGNSEVGRVRSQKPIPSPLFGYTHSLAKSPNSTKIWSGRPESNNASLIGIHGVDQIVEYYGHELINDTLLRLWWDEIADILLSENIIIPISTKETKKQGTLTEKDGNLVIEINTDSGNPGAGIKSFVSSLSNLCDARHGTPKDSCTHYRCRVKTYPLPKSKDIAPRRHYPSVSIRNMLSVKVAYISILHGLRELVEKPGGQVLFPQNKGEIWELVEKSNGHYLSKPDVTPLRITIVPLAKRHKDPSSKTVYHPCYGSQGRKRHESCSSDGRPPTLSNHGSSNQRTARAPPLITPYGPSGSQNSVLSMHENWIRGIPGYSKGHEHGDRSDHHSSVGADHAVRSKFSEVSPTHSRSSTSSTSLHAQSRTEEPKEKKRARRGFSRLTKSFRPHRHKKSSERSVSSEEERKEERRKGRKEGSREYSLEKCRGSRGVNFHVNFSAGVGKY